MGLSLPLSLSPATRASPMKRPCWVHIQRTFTLQSSLWMLSDSLNYFFLIRQSACKCCDWDLCRDVRAIDEVIGESPYGMVPLYPVILSDGFLRHPQDPIGSIESPCPRGPIYKSLSSDRLTAMSNFHQMCKNTSLSLLYQSMKTCPWRFGPQSILENCQ